MAEEAGGKHCSRTFFVLCVVPASLKTYRASLAAAGHFELEKVTSRLPPDHPNPAYTRLGVCEENTFVKRLKQIVWTCGSSREGGYNEVSPSLHDSNWFRLNGSPLCGRSLATSVHCLSSSGPDEQSWPLLNFSLYFFHSTVYHLHFCFRKRKYLFTVLAFTLA